MCGRFVLMSLGRDLAERFHLSEMPDPEPRYNIAPTQMVAVVRRDEDSLRRRLDFVRWGLVPSWAKDLSIGSKLINARAETASQKPAFRAAFRYRRCLVPADGFYDWERGKGRKQPYLVSMADGSTFAFAGLWEKWHSAEGKVIESCTILTTDANELLSPIHDRMPVILRPENYDVWLDPEAKQPELLLPLLIPYPAEQMAIRVVSPKVNKSAYDAPDCIEPYHGEEG